MADEQFTKAVNRIYDKMEANQKDTKQAVSDAVSGVMEYAREHDALIRAEVASIRDAQIKFRERQEQHSNDIATNKQTAERLSKEEGAKAGALRGGVVSFIISFIFMILTLWYKTHG